MTRKSGEHTFSIEMGSKQSFKNVQLSEGTQGGVLIEGNLGKLEEITLHEDIMLEVQGVHGTLRLDIDRVELEGSLRKRDTVKESKE